MDVCIHHRYRSNSNPLINMKAPGLIAILSIAVLIASEHGAYAQGVMIQDASTASMLPLGSSHINVVINDQVALVTSAQSFINDQSDTLTVKYGYPLAVTASATRVRWMLADSVWHTASMVAEPQDTILPGTGGGASVDPLLQGYLGETPLYFNINNPIPPGAWMVVEISYVELLPYGNARVEFSSASDYSQLFNQPLLELSIDVSLLSQRSITGMDISGTGNWSPQAASVYVSNDSASLHIAEPNVPASCGFIIGYDLDPSAYGITSMSNFLPDSLVKCDQLGNGFFVLLIEPEPTSEVVMKDFVIVIDKSGSMSGTKIQEARDAATFMVNNLNLGDAFNVVAFDGLPISWNGDLQPFTANNMLSALSWIDQINADGGTNINDALTMGIQDFSSSVPGHARSIVFLTDGQDQSSNASILANAQQLRLAIAPDLQLFTFGIGEGYNEQLLNQLAVQNNGLSQFLETANFSDVMSDFYTQIQDPVLLSPTATFDHPDVQHTYPDPLLGLYVGQQMAIVGRYDIPGTTQLHLAGFANGTPVTFDYAVDLSGAFDENKLFVTKVWAQKAVEALVNEFYSYDALSAEGELLHDSIVNFSMCWGVGSPFTSFTDDGGGTSTVGIEESPDKRPTSEVATYPQPSISGAPVVFDLSGVARTDLVTIRILDVLGRILFTADITSFCGDQWTWNGRDANGNDTTGELIFMIDDGKTLRSGHLTRL